MKIISKIIIVCILGVLFTSCHQIKPFLNSYHYYDYNYIIWNKECQQKSEQIFLFTESDSLDFKYTIIGEIKAEPGEHTSKKDFLTLITFDAWDNCAEGIINLPDYLKDNKLNTYDETELIMPSNIKYARCTTIKIKKDSAFIAKYGNKMDLSFIEKGMKLKKESDQYQKRTEDKSVTNILYGFFAIFGLFLFFTVIFFLTTYPHVGFK